MTDFQKTFFFDAANCQRSCKDKKGYDTKWQAQFAIDEVESKYNVKLTFYLCKYCGKWHLTSTF